MAHASIAVVGGGVAGLLTGLLLAQRGHACRLFERGPAIAAADGPGCSRHAGGMLAPLSELDVAEPVLTQLGLGATAGWREILGAAAEGDLFDAQGSLLVAHRPEWPLLQQLWQRAESASLSAHIEAVGSDRIAALEPWLAGRVRRGVWIASEGVVHPERLLPALAARFCAAGGEIHTRAEVTAIEPGALDVIQNVIGTDANDADRTTHRADVIIDCRGLGARPDAAVRGVRGEYVVVKPRQAPGAPMPQRPVRLMHPRYPLYVVPRPDGRLYIGATQLESEHDGPLQVRSALELLSALYSLDPGFADAEIEHFGAGLRPAHIDNLPRIESRPGLIALNGLFRHGYLLAPKLCSWVVDIVEARPLPAEAMPFWQSFS